MAHKSHRQKALQSQLEERPAISLIDNDPKPKKSTKTKKVKPTESAVVEGETSGNGMDVDLLPTQPQPESMHVEDDDGDVLIDNATASTSTATATGAGSSGFAPLAISTQGRALKDEFRRISIPQHRMTPLKRDWVNLYTPMVEHLGLQVRMNPRRRAVELKVSPPLSYRTLYVRPDRDPAVCHTDSGPLVAYIARDTCMGSTAPTMQTSDHTVDTGSIQKGADFVKAYALGFDVNVSSLLHLITCSCMTD